MMATFLPQYLATFYAILLLTQYELIICNFSNSVTRMIISLSAQTWHTAHQVVVGPKEKANQHFTNSFENRLQLYDRIHGLVEEYNDLFAWVSLLYKIAMLLQICISMFVTVLKVSHVSPGTVLFIYTGATAVVRISTVLICMGRTRKKALEFKAAGLQTVSYSALKCIHRLKYLRITCFRIGNFYSVSPTTFLTYSSILSTYLVLCLQI